MKRLFLLLVALLTLTVGVDARTFCLIVGVSSYENSENDLSQTSKDAKAFKAVMETQTNDITLLTSKYANHDNIMEKLRAICNRAQEGDRIIFFFSGHGYDGGICPYDRAIQYEELIDALVSSAASEKICFIDACHAGSMANTGSTSWTDTVKDNNLIFFVSSRAEEYSIESPFLGAGLFTQSLLKGLRGKADDNHDKRVTVLELFKYLHKDIVRSSEDTQHPQLIAPKASLNRVLMVWK